MFVLKLMRYSATICIGLLVVLIVSCTDKQQHAAEIKLKKHFITQQIRENEILLASIEEVAGKSRRPYILSVVEKSKQIISCREKYFNDQGIESLLFYS